MIAIESSGHYFHRVGEGEALPPLDARLRAVCRERFRRMDRFIELALLGSGECAGGKPLAADCGLYISSGIGPIGTNVLVQDAVSRDAKLPMPFNFVNTLGSSAGFYVGKNLGLTGESTFLCRRGGSFGAALACAAADLELGLVSQALVGAIEECLLPTRRFRELVGLAPNAQMAEGSHWLLLSRAEVGGTPVTQERLDAGEFSGYEGSAAAVLASFVQRNADRRFGLSLVQGSNVHLMEL
jgi:hypothetical protein